MEKKLTLRDLSVNGKKVLMRVDFNVPIDSSGVISDDTRIKASLPSIRYILDNGGSIILMSHLGRPDGKRSSKYSLAPCAKRLAELLSKDVTLAPDCIGSEVESLAANLKPRNILLLENLRFHSEEENGDIDFSKKLAALGDCYVNDAFGTAHREHASTAIIAKFFPQNAAAGFLMQKEINFLGDLLRNPKHPFCAIVGGAKISTKISTLRALLPKVDTLIVGGAMAYTFFKAQGFQIGDSLCEDKFIIEAQNLLEESKKLGVNLLLPIDSVVADSISEESKIEIVSVQDGIAPGWKGVDIGPRSIELFVQAIEVAETILWNGPLGIFEIAKFSKGTNAIACAVAASAAKTVVGGGDTIAAVESVGIADKISHISTGGGASLEFLENGSLPGIEALSDALCEGETE